MRLRYLNNQEIGKYFDKYHEPLSFYFHDILRYLRYNLALPQALHSHTADSHLLTDEASPEIINAGQFSGSQVQIHVNLLWVFPGEIGDVHENGVHGQ